MSKKCWGNWRTTTPPWGMLWLVIQTALLTLKLDGTLGDLSWWIVLAPCWVMTAIMIILFIVVSFILRGVLAVMDKKTRKEVNENGSLLHFWRSLHDNIDDEEDDEDEEEEHEPEEEEGDNGE